MYTCHTYRFKTEADWYTAQRILGAHNISYNSFKIGDYWIIES